MCKSCDWADGKNKKCDFALPEHTSNKPVHVSQVLGCEKRARTLLSGEGIDDSDDDQGEEGQQLEHDEETSCERLKFDSPVLGPEFAEEDVAKMLLSLSPCTSPNVTPQPTPGSFGNPNNSASCVVDLLHLAGQTHITI